MPVEAYTAEWIAEFPEASRATPEEIARIRKGSGVEYVSS